MKTYNRLPATENVFFDWLFTWYNLTLMKKIIIKIAEKEHEITGRQTHIAVMFNSYVIFDSRDRDDINKSGKVMKMNVIELYKASIWNSDMIRKKHIKIVGK
jgi:hypothetical protein